MHRSVRFGVSRRRWQPPEVERGVGLDFYATETPPVRARLKSDAADFEVREISAYPMPDPAGPYAVLRVQSRDWEQHELAQRLAQRLGLGPHAISWSGTKDRRALSDRLFSYRGRPPDGPVELPGVTVLDRYAARDGLSLGHHYGNAFAVHMTAVEAPADVARERLEAVREELRAIGGFPNLFGLQRFGEVRPVTHLVGRALVRGEPAEAADLYLTWVAGGSDGLGADARRAYARHRDPARALREFPASFRFERLLLDRLARGQPAARAIGALSRELRTLFVHAFQSLLFNRWISRRDAAGLSAAIPETGDRLLRVARDGTIPGAPAVPVGNDNLSECRDLARRGRAVLAGPLVGYETPQLTGAAGDLFESLLDEEKVHRKDLRIPSYPELASRGTWRPITVPTPPIALSFDPGGGTEDATGLGGWLRFSLPRGTYATILIREFLKSGATAVDVPSSTSF